MVQNGFNIMNKFIEKLRDELEKEDKSTINFTRCSNLINDIEYEVDMMEYENQYLDSSNYD